MTSGCTAQACSLRDGYEELRAQGYKVIGVSVDEAKRHLKFIEKNELPFDFVHQKLGVISILIHILQQDILVIKLIHIVKFSPIFSYRIQLRKANHSYRLQGCVRFRSPSHVKYILLHNHAGQFDKR